MKQWKMLIGWAIGFGISLQIGGCATGGDTGLNKSYTQFAADAAKRTYEATAPRGGDAAAYSEYDVQAQKVDFTNTSTSDWDSTEVWLNKKYVVFIPHIAAGEDKKLIFGVFFDGDGNPYDTNNGQNPPKTLEIFRNGKMYDVKLTMN